jgi:predicted nucleic-acid-binding protein
VAALDTNVLVRFLVRDDEAQLQAARRLIETHLQQGMALFVPVTVFLELEWVLRARYRFNKVTVVKALSDLLSTQELSFDREHALEIALNLYKQEGADLADCLHLALAHEAHQAPLWTFDRLASRLPGAQAVPV